MTQQATVAPRDSSTLQSVERACAVLEYLAACDEPQTASQVSRALTIERTAAHRLLRSLLKSGIVWSERPSLYSIGPRALAIGMSYVEQMQVRRIALPYLMELSFEYTERPWSIVLAMFDGKDILLVERLWNPRTPLNSLIEIGGKMPIDRTAAGWAYLARLTDSAAAAIVGHKRFEEIRPKIEQARDSRGIAFASGELQPGIDALSAPIVDSTGRVVALVIVGGTDFHDELNLDSPTASRVLRIVTRVSDTLATRR
ncbi:MAG: helix-turn-helix domain-containing protein [Actinomycetota bacterium]|nr:helix-turn-helix domain-containing protein [Actinomycetota bacterium]